MFLVTIGIVYGDIGTSPMYVMKSILEGNGGIGGVDEAFIIGALSLVIWTVTLLTTVKYVLIAMKADNHGEGGIFSLYSLVRGLGKWLIFPAMLGGAALASAVVGGSLFSAILAAAKKGYKQDYDYSNYCYCSCNNTAKSTLGELLLAFGN